MKLIVSAGVLFLAAISLFGWGALVRRIAQISFLAWPTTTGLGLCAVLAIGGMANLARVSFAPMLWIIAALGLLFFLVEMRRKTPSLAGVLGIAWVRLSPSERIEAYAAAALIALTIAFAITTQLPPDVFNFHDDLQKYFAHPIRKLATGTLVGSPLSALGSETLGGTAFLQSFVLSVFPLPYINGVDAVFGLALVMTLGAAAGWRRIQPLPGAVLAPLLIACIEPQYVNVSALYLGSALIAVAIMLTAEQAQANVRPAPLALGLVYAGLTALKPTFAIFPAVHLPLAAIAIVASGQSVRECLIWVLRVFLWSTLFIAPWIALHAQHYLGWSHIEANVAINGPSDIVNLFSTAPLFYGASMAAYSSLLMLAGLVIALRLLQLWNPISTSGRYYSATLVAAGATAVLIYGIFLFALSLHLAGVNTNLRYSIPFLIGIVPIVATLSLSARRLRTFQNCATITALLVTTAIFIPSLIARYRQAIEHHTILAFSNLARNPAYLQFNQMALSANRSQTIQAMQRLIPEKQPILAWINQPFHLDFERNPILDAEPAGLSTPWARLPSSVQYVIWEYQGDGVRTAQDYSNAARGPGWHERLIAERTLNFAIKLNENIRKGTVLFANQNFVVARLPSP